MKKQRFLKFLSLAISVCLLMSSLFTGMVISAEDASVDVWDGTSVSTELSGSGTSADPYLIQSGADLKLWSNKAAGGKGYVGEYFLLTNDIDLGGKNLVIATFSGIFDGNGYEIKGIQIVYNTLNDVGFFRRLGGTVKNLTLTGSVWGKQNVGGFAGIILSTGATISNCVSNMTVKGESAVAGIFGNAYHTNAVTLNIFSCVNNGTVTSTTTNRANTAGIVGYVGSMATVNVYYSQNNGDITNTAVPDVAGIVGKSAGTVNAKYCVNTGKITGASCVGGILGYNETATAKATIDHCVNYGQIVTSRTGGATTSIGAILGLFYTNVSNTTVTNSYYCKDDVVIGTAADYQATYTPLGTAKAKADFTNGTVVNALGFLYIQGENGPELRQYSEGDGTKNNPYVLKTKEDLLMLSQIVTVGQLTNYTDMAFVLANDIDLQGDARFVGIGNGYKSFQADFNGNGYTVSGVDIKHAHLAGLGFFGMIGGTNERKITNLNVKGNITSTASTNNASIVGGLVGKNAVKLTISNCSFDGTVYSTFITNANYSAASGIICEVAGALDMSNCYVAGKIDGFGRGGSLVGSLNGNYAVNITNCYSVAEVTGIGANKSTTAPTSGGLIGFIGNGTLRLNNCFFAGTAPAERSSGMGGPIVNHYAAGTFECNNVYYLADSASEFTSYNVGVNKTAAQFKDGTVLDLLNTNGVVFAQGENYPILMTKPYDVADLTADGIVDTADAVVILRHIESVEQFGEDAMSFADVNGDGSVTEADYFTVKYIALVGIVVEEPEAASWSMIG